MEDMEGFVSDDVKALLDFEKAEGEFAAHGWSGGGGHAVPGGWLVSDIGW